VSRPKQRVDQLTDINRNYGWLRLALFMTKAGQIKNCMDKMLRQATAAL
jgi:hypothetical protein